MLFWIVVVTFVMLAVVLPVADLVRVIGKEHWRQKKGTDWTAWQPTPGQWSLHPSPNRHLLFCPHGYNGAECSECGDPRSVLAVLHSGNCAICADWTLHELDSAHMPRILGPVERITVTPGAVFPYVAARDRY